MPSVAPAIAPARMARKGVVTGPMRFASNPAIGKLRNAKTQNSQKRQYIESSFIINSFLIVDQAGMGLDDKWRVLRILHPPSIAQIIYTYYLEHPHSHPPDR
jgi:hypothetical protein